MAVVLTSTLDTAVGLVIVTATRSGVDLRPDAGTPITVEGAVQTDYNGNFVVYDTPLATTYRYWLDTNVTPVTPATGTINVRIYTLTNQTRWSVSSAVGGHLSDNTFTAVTFVLNTNNGQIYSLDSTKARDVESLTAELGQDDSFIDFTIRTGKLDFLSKLKKFIARAEVVGDISAVEGLVRYTDNDYGDWSLYRKVDLESDRPRLTKQGSTRRRAYEVRKPWDRSGEPVRLEALELFTKQGINN